MIEFESRDIGNGLFRVKIDGVELKELYPLLELGPLYAKHWKGSDSHKYGNNASE